MGKPPKPTPTEAAKLAADVEDETAPAPTEQGAPAPASSPAAPRGAVRVTAPGGDRRRAGFAFGPAPRTLTLAEIVDHGRDPEAVMAELMADPQLAVVPVL